MVAITTENKLGSDTSGTNGQTGRILTLSNTNLTIVDGFIVSLAGVVLTYGTDYTLTNNSAASTVTFNVAVLNASAIQVKYFQISPYVFVPGMDDFEKGPLLKFGTNVVWTPVTMTTGFSGQKTYSDGTDSAIRIVFQNPTQNFILDIAGLTEVVPDALIFCTHDILIKKYDKITFNRKIYRVEKVSDRFKGSTLLFKRIDLFFNKNE